MTNDQEQRSLMDANDDPNPDANPNPDPPEDDDGEAAPSNGGDGGNGADAEALPFEEAIEELEAIVGDLEDGDLPLEEAMERFERGLGLVEVCRSKLKRAELKVEELLEDGSTEEIE